jgi:hypothetical protein
VGLLAVVAAVLVAVGPVAGSSGLGPQVARIVKTGVCVVGGDICRTADAEAAGLAPCTLAERREGNSAAITILSVRLAGGGELGIGRRSDGSILVVRSDDGGLGVTGGLGLTAGPVQLGVQAGAGVTVARATAWALPDEAELRRFLTAVDLHTDEYAHRWPPLWRSGDVGLATSGWAGLGVGQDGDLFGVALYGGAEVAAETAAGVRIGRGTTTYYIRAASTGPQLADSFGRTAGARSRGPVVAEYTRDAHGPRELAFRVTYAGSGQTVETVARLDLRAPESRALAARLLRRPAPWPSREVEDAIRRATAVGTVERNVYAVEDDSSELAIAGRLGLEVGAELGHASVSRRLVEASAWTPGSRERAREDCMG